MRDLMVAQQYANPAFLAGLPTTGSLFRGAVDGNHVRTPALHRSHMLGMNFDLSIKAYLSDHYMSSNAPVPPAIVTNALTDPIATGQNQWLWSTQNALDLSAQLPNLRDQQNRRNFQSDALRNFLALYSVTRSDSLPSNNSWDELPVTNGSVLTALFGDGSRDGSIIYRTIIGSRNDPRNPTSASLLSWPDG
jgi:hypothetical protein